MAGLGKGLDALFATANIDMPQKIQEKVIELDLNQISPMQGQPREQFAETELNELAESIKQHGVLQPIIVRKEKKGKDTFFRIVAGERRWRAAKIAKLKVIPALIREIDDNKALQQAIIENIQRVDLNPIEEAKAFERLQLEYSLTQEELAKILGRSRSAVANSLRLNNLATSVKKAILQETITEGHGRTLLGLTEKQQQKALDFIQKERLSVRQTEVLVKKIKEQEKNISHVATKQEVEYQLNLKRIQERLTKKLATKVRFNDQGGKGQIVITYSNLDELDRLLEELGSK